MRRAPRTLCTLLGAGALACGETEPTTLPEYPTLIVVEPARFLGDTPCGDVPGGVRSYVATLVDVTLAGVGDDAEPDKEFALPSSPPVPCTESSSFTTVASFHWYAADIDAYDVDDIKPRGPGSFLMVDRKTGEHVAPRWTASCGRSAREDPLLALHQNSRTMHRCTKLTDHHPEGPTGVSVTLEPLLGDLECGDGAGEVDRYLVALEEDPSKSAEGPCSEPLSLDELPPNHNYRFLVQAFEAGASSARWETTCFAKTAANAVVPASCDPLRETGDGAGGSGGDGGAGGSAGTGGAGSGGEARARAARARAEANLRVASPSCAQSGRRLPL